MAGGRSRARTQARARVALNTPKRYVEPTREELLDSPRARQLDRRDWPAIRSAHPHWWQVHRIERVNGAELRYVLIAECRTEGAAFLVAHRQQSQTRITKWGDKRPPYRSARPPREVDE
jgi:hypothetical protein